jgi:hypothetical protein
LLVWVVLLDVYRGMDWCVGCFFAGGVCVGVGGREGRTGGHLWRKVERGIYLA